MARAHGARAQMALAFESVYGTAPASGYRTVPFASTTLGSEQPLIPRNCWARGATRWPRSRTRLPQMAMSWCRSMSRTSASG